MLIYFGVCRLKCIFVFTFLIELLIIFHVNFQVNIPKVKSSQKAFDVNFQGTDPNVESSKVLDNILLSLVFGCFALLVPSGLSLYW
jgi:uncharacterized Fe-S radical SAM superfamily protein PflX